MNFQKLWKIILLTNFLSYSDEASSNSSNILICLKEDSGFLLKEHYQMLKKTPTEAEYQ